MIGRTKLDSVELEDKPADSHVASTDQDEFGKIFRRNMPYGTVTDHGTMFVGFCADAAAARGDAREHGRPRRPARATRSRATREPLTGAYYFVPSAEALMRASESATA